MTPPVKLKWKDDVFRFLSDEDCGEELYVHAKGNLLGGSYLVEWSEFGPMWYYAYHPNLLMELLVDDRIKWTVVNIPDEYRIKSEPLELEAAFCFLMYNIPEIYNGPEKAIKKAMELLLNRGVDVNARNGRGETLLHCYTDQEHPCLGVVKELVERGALVDLVDRRGRTPVHNLVQDSSHDVFFYFCDIGFYPDIWSPQGTNLIQVSCETSRAHFWKRIVRLSRLGTRCDSLISVIRAIGRWKYYMIVGRDGIQSEEDADRLFLGVLYLLMKKTGGINKGELIYGDHPDESSELEKWYGTPAQYIKLSIDKVHPAIAKEWKQYKFADSDRATELVSELNERFDMIDASP